MLCLLASLGWDDTRAAELAHLAELLDDELVAGRVSGVDRGAADVLTEDNPVRVVLRHDDPPLAVGDWVGLAADDRRWRLAGMLPRRGAITRAAATGESHGQTLAANVDVVLVTVAALPEPRLGMVERMVALAWDSGATPVVVVTKADLGADPAGLVERAGETAPGVDVVAVTAARPDGFDPLAPYVGTGRTCCLLGRSGAGKSTLANALLGEERLATGPIRADGKGRHTTTRRELLPLPAGGVLIDTPGLRGVGLWLGEDGLERAFTDLEELAADCRFGDCDHRTEPGCAVLAAIDAGVLPQRRLDSWRKLQREAAWIAARSDARLRAERSRQWKAVAREGRQRSRPGW